MAEQAQADVDARAGAVAGRLVLASLPTATRGLAAPALRHLAAAHPALHVELTEADSSESIPALVSGAVDLVIAHDWSNAPLAAPDGLTRTLLLEDRADIAVPATHPLARQAAATRDGAVPLAELGAGPWICGAPGTSCHDWLTFTLRSARLEPRFAHTANELATQLSLVAAGLGIAVMPRLGRGQVPAGVQMIAVRPGPAPQHLRALAHHRGPPARHRRRRIGAARGRGARTRTCRLERGDCRRAGWSIYTQPPSARAWGIT